MSVDMSDLTDAFTEWANRSAGQALESMFQLSREHAPYGASEEGHPGPHLVDTEEATILQEGEVWVGELAYRAEHASYLDEGTGPHLIAGSPLLSFMWQGHRVIVHSVQHPGSTAHVGWFSNTVTDDAWANELETAMDAETL